MSTEIAKGQRVLLDACPGFDINNTDRELYGEFKVTDIFPHEVELYPCNPDRYARYEDQLVFVNLPLPGAHHFAIDPDLNAR